MPSGSHAPDGFLAATVRGIATGGAGGAATNRLLPTTTPRLGDRSPVPRLARDINVNPEPPRILDLTRPVSRSATQNAFVQQRALQLEAMGALDIRVNQQQVNVDRIRVGVNRPDLQYTLKGVRYYEEFDVPSSNRGPFHEARIRANDPDGVARLFVVP